MKSFYSSRVQGLKYSPWPIMVGFTVYGLVVSLVCWLHLWTSVDRCLAMVFLVMGLAFTWWRDIVRESTFQGEHTKKEQKSLWVGFILFVCSEVMLFVSLFWAFFHSSLAPTVELGCMWPPKGIKPVEFWRAPISMSALLVGSGFIVNWAMHALKSGVSYNDTVSGLVLTICFGGIFVFLQWFEYCDSCFTICDSVFGSTFFLVTGFHGAHVIAGLIFLVVQCARLVKRHFSTGHHLGLEFSVWYWHFVDVIWLFVVVFIYGWGGWGGAS